MKLIVSYGGGTNSTALLIGLLERAVVPDLILFADTGNDAATPAYCINCHDGDAEE